VRQTVQPQKDGHHEDRESRRVQAPSAFQARMRQAMANRSEPGGPRYVEPENRRANGVGAYAPGSEPSLPAALEKLASATQGVITKRIDLVMLEINALVGTLVVRTALVIFGVIVGLAAWFGAISALVLWLTPNMGTVGHLAIFALVNAAIGAVVVFFAVREQLPKLAAEAEEEHERDDSRATAQHTHH